MSADPIVIAAAVILSAFFVLVITMSMSTRRQLRQIRPQMNTNQQNIHRIPKILTLSRDPKTHLTVQDQHVQFLSCRLSNGRGY